MADFAEHMKRKCAFHKVLEHSLWHDIQALNSGDAGSYEYVFTRGGLGDDWTCHKDAFQYV